MENSENIGNIDEELREREIKRLTSPLNYPRGRINLFSAVTDVEGNPVQPTQSFHGNKYIIEPKIGILTDDEILKYAAESKAASKIKLKRGIGSFSDKTKLYGDELVIIWMTIGFIGPMLSLSVMIFSLISGIFCLLFTLGIPTIYTIYVYHLKDYAELGSIKQSSPIEEDNLKSESIAPIVSKDILSFKIYERKIYELESLYKIKEKFVIELIEKRFSPPQITYDRFIYVINRCNELFYNKTESALDIIEVATEHTPKIDGKLKEIVNTLKSLLKKIDELTTELAINSSHSDEKSYSDDVKDLFDDMEKLVDSVKEYD